MSILEVTGQQAGDCVYDCEMIALRSHEVQLAGLLQAAATMGPDLMTKPCATPQMISKCYYSRIA